jgi:DNA repair exonuclease SbcCD ATPase subunit
MSELTTYRRAVDRKLAEYAAARTEVNNARAASEAADEAHATATAGLAFAQTVAEQVQAEAHRKVADVVSRCLAAVFPEPYTFTIKFVQRRGRTEAELAFVRDGEEYGPMDAVAGGVLDVAAFGLRLSSLLLARPPLRRLLVLDEPFRHLSADLRPRVKELLEVLTRELGVQMVFVTHDPALVVGIVIEL